jgi:hypothetical protein
MKNYFKTGGVMMIVAMFVLTMLVPMVCDAQSGGGSGTSFPNPINATSAAQLLGNILTALQSVVAVISIIFIVIGGIMYMTASGSEKGVDRAKAIISGALIGLAIVLAAPTFLKELMTILGNNSGSDPTAVVSQAQTLQQIATKVLTFLLSIVGILAIIALVIGGSMYLTAYGDEDRIEKGKKILTGALIGIAVSFAALLLVQQVKTLIGG